MQETLTQQNNLYKQFYITKSTRKQNRFFALLFFVIFIVVLFVVFGGGQSFNKTQEFYVLSLDNTKNKSILEQVQEEAEEVVGTSYVYKVNNVYHVVGFIYENREEALENLKQVKNYLTKAQILSITSKKIKNNVYNQIKQDYKINKIYKETCDVKNKVLSLCKSVKNNQSDMSVFRELTKIELNLNKNSNYLSKQKETGLISTINVSNLVNLSLIQGVKKEIAKSSSVLENLKILYIKVVFEEINLKNSLNKL